MNQIRERLIILPLEGYPRPIGAALWRMQDERERTLEAIKAITMPELDWLVPGLQNSIGTLLYHIAIIEMDWLYEEALHREWPPESESLFPYPVRDESGRLSPVNAVSHSDHLARFSQTRQYMLAGFKAMTVEEYRHPRSLPPYDVSPEWVMHHLIHHEAEHRGEIQTIRTLYAAKSG